MFATTSQANEVDPWAAFVSATGPVKKKKKGKKGATIETPQDIVESSLEATVVDSGLSTQEPLRS
jgi:hypothetical protein